MRKVALESTFYVYFSTRRFSSGASYTLAGTPAIHAYEDNSDTQITAGLTLSADADSITGLNRITVAATTANGFEAGKHYTLTIGAGTIDSVSVVGTVVGEFIIETASELAVRTAQEKLYPAAAPTAFTGNTTSALNLTGIVASTAEASDIIGQVFAVAYTGGTYANLVIPVRVTAYAVTNQLATVETIHAGGALPEAVASGDFVFFLGIDPAYRGGAAMTEAGGDGDHLTEAGGTGDHLTALATLAILGIVTGDVNDASAAADDFEVTTDTGTDIRIGTLRFTSGDLDGESRLVKHEGTNILVLPTAAVTGLGDMEAYSAAPGDNDTYVFIPL